MSMFSKKDKDDRGKGGMVVDAIKKQLNFSEREKLAELERRVQQAKHNEVLASRKAEEHERAFKESERRDGFVGWMTGQNREKRLSHETTKRKALDASQHAREAEEEYKRYVEQTGQTLKKELLAPVSEDYRSPLLSATTRGAGTNFVEGMKKKIIGAVYPRTLFVTVIGASGLPKMDTIGWCDPYVVITNISTREKQKTEIIYDNPEPVWEENFVITISSARDTLVMEVFDYDRVGQDDYIGASILPLDTRFICNRECALEVTDKKKKNRGTLRVSAMWADEAQPTRETGPFYYRVVFAHGVHIRKLPDAHARNTGQTLQPGELFEASERLKPLDENTTYVRINTMHDKWMRGGWVFEKLTFKDEHTNEIEEVQVLERVTPPKREGGNFFYRVKETTRLPLEPEEHCRTFTRHSYPKDTILECGAKTTPLGSELVFCRVDNENGGFIIEDKQAHIIPNEGDTYAKVEHCRAPKSRQVESGALNEEQHFQIVCDPGVYARKSVELDAEKGQLLMNGEYFAANEKKVVSYPGVSGGKNVTWYKRIAPDNDWVREEKNGIQLIKEVHDSIETGIFMFEIVYQHGVQVRQFAKLHGPKHETVLVCGEIVRVRQKILHARELKKTKPTIWLELEDQSGWIFDHNGTHLIAKELEGGVVQDHGFRNAPTEYDPQPYDDPEPFDSQQYGGSGNLNGYTDPPSPPEEELSRGRYGSNLSNLSNPDTYSNQLGDR
mmetsp:Transcript_12892/g.16949  ORF Transcript_12892/g.16949 Transcript_12892/m.16949 type:complete len:727 (-) Transcript_12892:396-2576(-)